MLFLRCLLKWLEIRSVCPMCNKPICRIPPDPPQATERLQSLLEVWGRNQAQPHWLHPSHLTHHTGSCFSTNIILRQSCCGNGIWCKWNCQSFVSEVEPFTGEWRDTHADPLPLQNSEKVHSDAQCCILCWYTRWQSSVCVTDLIRHNRQKH